jgi:hypothetical protein
LLGKEKTGANCYEIMICFGDIPSNLMDERRGGREGREEGRRKRKKRGEKRERKTEEKEKEKKEWDIIYICIYYIPP